METNSKIHLSVKDYLVSGEIFNLTYNEELDFLKTVPQPKEEDLHKYYESEEYISHTDEKRGVLSFLYQTVKKWSLNNKTNLIAKENNGVGSLLDVGAGTGDFLIAAKNNGWKVFGVEPNKNALKLASEKGIELELNLDKFVGNQFDVVTLWHVLEHIPNLQETVIKLSNLVKPNGTLIIAVPNFKSYDAKYYKEYWAAYDVPRHLWHFTPATVEKLLNKHQFKIIKQKTKLIKKKKKITLLQL